MADDEDMEYIEDKVDRSARRRRSGRRREDDGSEEDLMRQGPVKVVYRSKDVDSGDHSDDGGGPSLWRRALRWTARYLAIPVMSVSAAMGGGVYYGVTHADEINQAIFEYHKRRAHEDAPTYGQILTQLRIRNGVHRRYEEIDDMQRGIVSICSEIDRVEGYECSRVLYLPRGPDTPADVDGIPTEDILSDGVQADGVQADEIVR